MTREELKAHCIRQIEQIEIWAKYKGEKPSGKVYEEHKLILELLEQEQKADNEWCTDCKEYDHEKHCCPRFSQVIKTTLQECCENAVSREDVLLMLTGKDLPDDASKLISIFGERIKNLPPVKPQEPRWIPVSNRLPKELEPVNVTWINHNPESYYADIKDKPFTATGVYFNGQWYWWSTLCTDILAEYSHNYDDIIDDDIEITAWMPLPESYKRKDGEK